MPHNLITDLNPDQQAATTYTGGPLLILAGAGSGKTRVLTYRAAHLMSETGCRSVLMLTFTNKAAQEMQHRLQKLINSSAPFAGTFHRFCAQILRRDGHFLGLSPNYQIYDDADQLDVIKHIMAEHNLSPKDYKPGTFLSQIHQAKNELITPEQYAQFARGSFQEACATIYSRYQKLLLKVNAVDFDDLLLFVVKLFQGFPQIINQYQFRFQHVLVDEYQDTNKAQYQIVKALTNSHQQLTVVGDASQSIYRWRGADYRNLEYLKRDYPELRTIKLEQNYRSTQPILDAAFSVIAHNQSHPILSLWTSKQGGELISLYEAEDEMAEAAYVISHHKKTPAGQSCAVLYRTNAQSRAFEEACIKGGIPYILVGGTKFYERKEIKDLLAYLRFIFNPLDFVSEGRIEKLGKRKYKAFSLSVNKIDPNAQPTVIFDQIIDITKYLDNFDPKVEADLARLENIKELRAVTTTYESLGEFLESVALIDAQSNQNDQTKNNNRYPVLTLMTIHAAKGLEFDQVFLVGLEEGLFPHSRSLFEPAELEEERRLCYVAITRARTRLHLTYAQNRLYFGSTNRGMMSRFISEVPTKLLKPEGFTTTFVTKPAYHSTTNINDPALDQLLDGDIDLDTFLNS